MYLLMDCEDSESDSGFSELEGEDLVRSLQTSLEHEIKLLQMPTPYEMVANRHTQKEWAKAEKKRGAVYAGTSARTQRRKAENARKQAVIDAKLRESKGASMMRSFVSKVNTVSEVNGCSVQVSEPCTTSDTAGNRTFPTRTPNSVPSSDEIFTGYASDVSDESSDDADDESEAAPSESRSVPSSSQLDEVQLRIPQPPSLNIRKKPSES